MSGDDGAYGYDANPALLSDTETSVESGGSTPKDSSIDPFRLPGDSITRHAPAGFRYGLPYGSRIDNCLFIYRFAQVMADGSQNQNPFINIKAADGLPQPFPDQHTDSMDLRTGIKGTEGWKKEANGSKGDRIIVAFYRREGQKEWQQKYVYRRPAEKGDL